ncbi:MAG: hypothetical protein GX817_03385, partial [Elusimicrobia bacterium]|nr:hypothetical protein [Elusimicrobiota bacterium]
FNESGGPGFPDEGTSNPFTAFDAAMVKSRPKWNAMLVPVDKLGIQH